VNAGAYRGRFAPTPSGPLHFGSIVAAAGSRADALAHGGEWHLRIDDVDPPRVAPGATDAILRCLDAFGFAWDGPVVRQSERGDAYAAAFERLRALAHVYPCTCSRAQIAAAGLIGIEGPRYPGTCRRREAVDGQAAWRLDVDGRRIEFTDLLQGVVAQDIDAAVGDFVLRRADGVWSYHLACVVDDADAGFTHVVRGADLLDSTPRQILLQRLLDIPEPAYFHLPIVRNAAGEKLSKQTLAAAVDAERPAAVLHRALRFLGQPVPADLATAPVALLWDWACEHWSRATVPPAVAPLPSAP
jgi:glutamyl-Q tRNA(Asp) synthetase